MSDRWDDDLDAAKAAWSTWCGTVERVGHAALEGSLTHDEVDLAEGLRHFTRMVRLTLHGDLENTDPVHPYLDRPLGPTLKMGGDNPCGLYLSAPINGTDTYRLIGTRGSARWISFMAQRDPACRADGLGVFGDAIFTELAVDDDDTFELILAPTPHVGNWIETDRWSSRIMIRQFFADWGDVRPMDLTIENVTSQAVPKTNVTLDEVISGLETNGRRLGGMLAMMQSELAQKGAALNTFAIDVDDPTSTSGGVPGGNAVTMRWHLEPDEALLIDVVPPDPCAYWDVQLGNLWYESWDYRHFFSGICDTQAAHDDDGSSTIVLSERDPGVRNWIETCGHREGHLAVRWQLTDGQLPLPECRVVKVAEVCELTGLPAVSSAERHEQRRAMRAAVEQRFRP